MPTLKEFVTQTLNVNNIQGDPDKIVKKITEIARQRAVNNVAAISDEEVSEMVINHAELANKLKEEKAAKKEAAMTPTEKTIKEEKEADRKQKALEKERKVAGGEQTSLW